MDNLPRVADLLGDIEMLTIDEQDDCEHRNQRRRDVCRSLLAKLGIDDPETTEQKIKADIQISGGLPNMTRAMILRSLV
jgi:hypothetical protein